MFEQNPSILIFFQSKTGCTTLSSADVKFLLNQRKEAKFVIATFLWASITVHSKSKWVYKETVSLKIGVNTEMLVFFICMGTQDRTLIDINHYYETTMNHHKNWIWKLNINIHKVTFFLYQLLIFLNLCIIYLFRPRDCHKNGFYLPAARDCLLFHLASQIHIQNLTFFTSQNHENFDPLVKNLWWRMVMFSLGL